MSEKRPFLKHAAMQIAAGGSAGFVEVCIMHPLDLVKTRFQIQRTSTAVDAANNPYYYRSIGDCFKKMYRHEGVFSFWKGIMPPILVETPKRAVKFFTFEQYKTIFMFGSKTATPLTYSLAGLGAGLTEGLLVNPFEVVKVEMQANRQLLSQMPSTWSVTQSIIRNQGIFALNKGLTSTLGRNGVFNMIYFGFYHSVKGLVPEPKDKYFDFLRRFGIGLASGILATMSNTPFDVAKSRIQGPQPVKGEIKYKGLMKTLSIVYREEGLLALYKGFVPKVLRLGPGAAILMVIYEYAYGVLQKKFPD
ncbi:hypothetical protein CHUAL_012249 [Chamberlinius hualienensis]